MLSPGRHRRRREERARRAKLTDEQRREEDALGVREQYQMNLFLMGVGMVVLLIALWSR